MSQKQLEANRRNALKSTGPRTEEGKARSSRNAIKHGLLAQEVVIRAGDGAEDPTQFEALMEQLCNDLQPLGILEEVLVERIAVSYWRLRRAQRFEVGAIRRRLDWCNRRFESAYAEAVERKPQEAKTALVYEEELLDWAEQQEDLTMTEGWEALDGAWDELARDHGLDGTVVLNTPQRQQEFLAYLKTRGLAGDRLRERLLKAQRGIIERARKRVEKLEAELLETQRYDGLEQERAALLHALPDEDDVNRLIRYETMINRQLDRALNQLERLQRARQGDHIPAPVALDVNVTGVKEAG